MIKTSSSQHFASSCEVEYEKNIIQKMLCGVYKVCVYGLGHVGAPLASAWLRAGFHVIGVDKSPRVIECARAGFTQIPEPGVNEAFRDGLNEQRFLLYDDPIKASRDSFFKLICVPALIENGHVNLIAVKEVALAIAKGLKKGDVVSLNPSVPPGTTKNVVLPIIEGNNNHSLKAEEDFCLLYCPERIYEGRAIRDIEKGYPAVVAGYGKKSLDLGELLLSLISTKGVMKLSDFKTAEIEKLLEGVYRDANIALANEMAILCENLGISFWEAREAANSQPFCHIHRAGIGVGGACIPVYPQFVLHTAEEIDLSCKITQISREINESMPTYCVAKSIKLLEKHGHGNKSLKDSTVTLLGLSFRGGVTDTRLSPTYQVIDELIKHGVGQIRLHDPRVKYDRLLHENYGGIIFSNDLESLLANTDLFIIVADHPEYSNLSDECFGAAVVYDGRSILTGTQNRTHTIGIGDDDPHV
jgi:nucleotide sugar dehydrogenase